MRASGLVKRFGDRRAVDRVDVDLAAGECLAVLGPNGAGKSTLLRMLATLLRPDAGTLAVCGHALPEEAGRARAEIGYLGHDPLVYLDLTAAPEPGALRRPLRPARRARGASTTPSTGWACWPAPSTWCAPSAAAWPSGSAWPASSCTSRACCCWTSPTPASTRPGPTFSTPCWPTPCRDRGVVMVTHEVERGVALAGRLLVLRAGRTVLSEPTGAVDGSAFRARYEELVA